MIRTVLLLLLLSGCAIPLGHEAPQVRADAETEAACRQRAEQIYDVQHRADIYSPPPTINTPFSTNFVPGVTDRQLANEHEHQELINDCVRNTGTETSRAPQ
ncbi:MAG TPA: hypothetical protein VGG99_14995 [Acetobacteraceae bacterium]|jgi:hypothetical protein